MGIYDQSMKQVCSDIEDQQRLEDEKFMQDLEELDQMPLSEMSDEQYEIYMEESAKYCIANGLAMSNMDAMGEWQDEQEMLALDAQLEEIL